ncbi:hypothetical protein [Cyclobacterium qasimii]|uniref:Uncharacterized protein n=2 Tax=Cyclobacterium qasimii TaxID=1350429 RepID=S7WW87_9BACT|nr:hypothetical protein [Cyclobacterium qasimii]EPR68273.1 hypothetical protein ADICYQ_2743 [Cyclobacterium qasimii M12-11B]GEO19839.1 hypothetical protein CQA01_03730 [Cyclobacterium qasimii]
MENQLFNLFLKKGNIVIQSNEYRISLQLDYENGDHCQLALTDTQDLIQLLTRLSQQIWEDENYTKTPYVKQLYIENQNTFSWEIDSSLLTIEFNETENAIVLKHKGNNPLHLEINQVVEIVQILERLNI